MRGQKRTMKGWRGRLVRLNRRVQTKGGDVWNAGEVMRVTGTWRSGVHLEPIDRDPLVDNRGCILHIHRSAVTLLGIVPHPQLLRELMAYASADVLMLDDHEAEPFVACGLIEEMDGKLFDTKIMLSRAQRLGCPHTRISHVLAWLEEYDGEKSRGEPAYRITATGHEALRHEKQRIESGEIWTPPR